VGKTLGEKKKRKAKKTKHGKPGTGQRTGNHDNMGLRREEKFVKLLGKNVIKQNRGVGGGGGDRVSGDFNQLVTGPS